MHAERYTVAVTTDGNGDATFYTDVPVNGRILLARYVKTDFDDGSTFTITGETTGVNIWTQTGVNASATVATRQPCHSLAGVAAEYASGYAILDFVSLANERVKIVISSGGDTKTGTFYITVG